MSENLEERAKDVEQQMIHGSVEPGFEAVETVYEVIIQGHLASRRFQQFEDLAVTHQPNGETRLVGSMPDQAALYGLLNWLRDLGASLISVRRLDSGEGSHD